MYRIGICDDDEIVCTELSGMIEGIMGELEERCSLKTWYSGEALCAYLDAGNGCDLLFLDIELPGLNGVDAGKYIRDKLDDGQLAIVYISGHTGYAMQLFRLQPMDFLTKPVIRDEVQRVLRIFLKSMERRRFFLEFQTGNQYYRQACDDIIYLCSDDKKVRVVMPHEEKEFYGKLKDLLQKLPKHFMQIHKSFIVNQDYVVQYSYDNVRMENGKTLNISRPYKNVVREKLIHDKKEREAWQKK
ncbi:MAG: response regulator transcription factor [Lachnospiraceae bacterium]|jgi:DNA-binding LytR/AlgR family response regulator|nr:response regulator transcription factor [Lachnospiraceae bacterium]